MWIGRYKQAYMDRNETTNRQRTDLEQIWGTCGFKKKKKKSCYHFVTGIEYKENKYRTGVEQVQDRSGTGVARKEDHYHFPT